MKKFCLTAMAMMLMVCLMMSTALAVDATILRVDVEEARANGYYPNVRKLLTVGDDVYLFACLNENSYSMELLRWRPGMESAERYVDGMLYAAYFDNMEHAQNAIEDREMADIDPAYGVSQLFTDGERLLAMNHLNGKIFAISEKDGKPVYEELSTIKDTDAFYHKSEDYAYFNAPNSVLCVGDKLLWSYSDWKEDTGEQVRGTLVIDLKDGSVKTSALKNSQSITAYKDGKALVLCRDEENAWDEERRAYRPMDIMSYDPATDKAEKIGEFNYPAWQPEYLIWSDTLDALIYDSNTRVMGLFNNLKDEQQIGYIPLSYVNSVAMLGDSLVVCGNMDSGVFARTLSREFKTDEYINVYNGYMDEASRAFAEDYPQIPIYSVEGVDSQSAMSIDLLMNAGADAPDIMQLNVSYSAYTKLAAKGYCADLSGYPELAAYVNDLYPVYREAVTGPNGEIYALPMSAYSYDGFYINKKVMEDMKLTLDEMPTNLVELCEFVTRWNDEFVDEYSNYTVLEGVSDYKKSLFNLMFERYIEYYDATGADIKFDTPVFREMIAALEAMQSKELEASLKNPNPEVSDYKQGLIWRNDMLVSNWSDFTAESSDRIFIPMGLTKNADYYTAVRMEVIFLNPKTQHRESAVKLMEYMVKHVEDWYAYVLQSTKTEPLVNDYYDSWLKNQQEILTQLEKGLEEAPAEEKADWETQVADRKAYIEKNDENRKYTISPGALKTYREIVMPYVYVAKPSFLDASEDAATSEFNTLMAQYLDGKIDIAKFIREADGKLLVMQGEKTGR